MANKLHIDTWIRRAEPDFYSMFINAWIPFNAWYVDKFQETNDSKVIKALINSQNEIKTFITSLLQDTDPDCAQFCIHFSQLHIELEKKKLAHREEIISFKSIVFDKYKCNPFTKKDVQGINYQASQPTKVVKQYKALITRDQKNFLSITMDEYDVESLITDEQYVGLETQEMKEIILECFQKINPHQPVDLTTSSENASEFILINNNMHCKFRNDPELIAQAIIKIIYKLRCMLFHGELNPNDNNSIVYEHAFYMLRLIIKKIK